MTLMDRNENILYKCPLHHPIQRVHGLSLNIQYILCQRDQRNHPAPVVRPYIRHHGGMNGTNHGMSQAMGFRMEEEDD